MQPSPKSNFRTFLHTHTPNPMCSFALNLHSHSQPQTTINLLSISVVLPFSLLRSFHINFMIQYVFFCVCFFFFTSIMFMRFIYVVTFNNPEIFLLLNSILLGYNSGCKHSQIDRHLGCFQLLVIKNNAVVDIRQVFVRTCFHLS